MEKRYQVFVSSTYRDLIDERREVIQALLELDCIPAGMELFPAANESQWSLIRQVIDDCDYYIVILGGRYGSLTADGVSYTEAEYDYALSVGKPTLGFVHDDPGSIPSRNTDGDAETKARLEQFRDKVMQRLVRTFSTPEQLGSVVSRSLIKLIKTEPGEGWVRGRFATTSETAAELAELRSRVAGFELERATNEAISLGSIGELAQGEDLVDLSIEYSTTDSGTGRKVIEKRVPCSLSWNAIIGNVGRTLLPRPAPESAVSQTLTQLALKAANELPPDDTNIRVSIAGRNIQTIRNQLRALRIISIAVESSGSRLLAPFRLLEWNLTPYGEELLLNVVALRKGQRSPSRD